MPKAPGATTTPTPAGARDLVPGRSGRGRRATTPFGAGAWEEPRRRATRAERARRDNAGDPTGNDAHGSKAGGGATFEPCAPFGSVTLEVALR